MTSHFHHLRKIFILALLLGTTACSGLFAEEKTAVACPPHLILKDAAVTEGTDWQAKVERIAARCEANNEHLDMELGVRVSISRAKADVEVPKTVDYFIAILDADENVVQKQTMRFTPDFSANPLAAQQIDEADLSFALPASYTIYVGFPQ